MIRSSKFNLLKQIKFHCMAFGNRILISLSILVLQ